MIQIILILSAVIALVIISAVRWKIHPVFSLIIAALIVGFALGFKSEDIIGQILEGFGKTLSSIGLVIAFGTTIGVFLEKTNGTMVIANAILKRVSSGKSPLAMNLVGFIVSIPVFCDSGFVILSSLNKALSKKTGIPLVVFAVALSTGLYATHVFVPPTPGPLAAAAVLEADLGLVMLIGFLIAIPVSLSGYFWARFIGRSATTEKHGALISEDATKPDNGRKASLFTVLLPLFVPVVLIALKSIADYPTRPLGENVFTDLIAFLGTPVIALFIGLIFVFMANWKIDKSLRTQWTTDALKEAGIIILVTGAGGAFGAVLKAADIGAYMEGGSFVGQGLLLAYFISAILKSAQGSSTVAIITTAAIIAPLLSTFGMESSFDRVLMVLAVGAGALTVSHVNDSYFWVVSQFSDLSVKEALRSHTLATLVQGLTAIVLIILLHNLFG